VTWVVPVLVCSPQYVARTVVTYTSTIHTDLRAFEDLLLGVQPQPSTFAAASDPASSYLECGKHGLLG
jgi:hypothetical protein